LNEQFTACSPATGLLGEIGNTESMLFESASTQRNWVGFIFCAAMILVLGNIPGKVAWSERSWARESAGHMPSDAERS